MVKIVEPNLVIITLVNNDAEQFMITRKSLLQGESLDATHLVFDSSSLPVSEVHSNDSRQINFIRVPPMGIYRTMNFALEWVASHVIGNPYLLFLNSGDCLTESFVCNIESLRNEKANIIYGKYNVIDSTTGLQICIDPIDWSPCHQYFTFKPISHQAILVRQNCFIGTQSFNTEFKIAADWDFILRCSKKEKFHYLGIAISDFYLGGFSSKNKRLANEELYELRKIHGPKSILFKATSFIFYQWRNLRLLLLDLILEKNHFALKLVRLAKGWR